jgi:WD40 repeat protein
LKRRIVCFLLLLLSSPLLMPQQRWVPIDISHFGKITDLVYDGERHLLFSAGEDGTVRIWNTEEKKHLGSVRISHRPVQRLAVHPSQPHLAVLVGELLQAGTLEVWDWQRGERLFTVESDKQLMYFAYSPKGNYLFYSQADYKSLTVVNPKTGRVLPYMGSGFGIVSYFTVARNEGNIMTYQPSGFISYWDIRTGRMIKQVRAPANLDQIRISPNSRYIAASTGQELVLVDVLSGEIVDSTRVAGIVDLSFSTVGNEISGVVETENTAVVKKWYFGGKYLIELTTAFETRFPQSSCLVYSDRDLYLATSDGSISAVVPGGNITGVAENRRMEIFDLAFYESTLAIASAREIAVFDSEFFLRPYNSEQDADIELRELRFPNPFGSSLGITYLDSRRLLLWRKSEEEGKLALLNTWYGGIQDLPVVFESPIRKVTVSSQGIVVVEESGRCRILDPDTFATTFEYHAPGMNKLIFTFGDILIGAKTSLSTFAGPLLQINRRTGETVPIQDPSLFVYDILYSGMGRSGELYSLAVEQRAGQVRTVVKVHSGFAFERSRILQQFDGEDLGATLAGDDSGTVYTTLGYESVKVFSGSQSGALEASGQIPRSLYVHDDKVFTLNRDSSISVWEIRSRRLLLNIHMFDTGSWTALTPTGGIRLSREEDWF